MEKLSSDQVSILKAQLIDKDIVMIEDPNYEEYTLRTSFIVAMDEETLSYKYVDAGDEEVITKAWEDLGYSIFPKDLTQFEVCKDHFLELLDVGNFILGKEGRDEEIFNFRLILESIGWESDKVQNMLNAAIFQSRWNEAAEQVANWRG